MSISVSAFSGALTSLQSLLKQGSSAASGGADGTDPLSKLLDSLSGPNSPADQIGAAANSAATKAGQICSHFSNDMMNSLTSMQANAASGSESPAPSADAGSTDSASTGNAADIQIDADQFAQWIETQAQALLPAATSLLALV